MKNLILQHWCGEFGNLEQASISNILWYSYLVEAEHKVILGKPFDSGFSPNAQKLVVLSSRWDEFDNVAIFDCDMFAVTALKENVFHHLGNGFHQEQAHRRVVRAFPSVSSATAPFWGGPLYRFNREERRRLREQIDLDELRQFDNATGGWDEGMMHRLAMRAKLAPVYLDYRWAYGNCDPQPEQAFFIHIRHRPSRDKMDNYRTLAQKGIIQ